MKIRDATVACLAALTMLLGLSLDAFARPASAASDAPAWEWPLQPAPDVVAYFDPPATPYGPGHLGVDLLGYPGQTVHATAAGTVSFAGQVASKPVVVVDHGMERSTYEPVVAAVGRGDSIVAGQPIGSLVLTAGHCLPSACLHLGRRAGDTYLDPLELLGGGPVRLLPRVGSPSGVTPLVLPVRTSPPVLTSPPALAPGPVAMLALTAIRGLRLGVEAARAPEP